MLWLDSAFPLDKPTSAPGVRRGTCPGGENSSPTHLRETFPDGYVMFANAAIGEIGSTLLGSTGPFRTTPAPPCVEQCSARSGQNTPECNGQTEDSCQQMVQYENKCKWTECQVTTMAPTSTTSTTTSAGSATTSPPPPSTTSAVTTCTTEAQMMTCMVQGGVFECSRCPGDATSEACCSCQGGETSTTTTTTTPLTQGVCKSWCKPAAAPWEKKCKWMKCLGCLQCNSRRLQESSFV